MIAIKMDIVVIGAGQAGLSSAYHLRRLGLEPDRDFVTFDQAQGPGGAWQFRWPSLTLATTNRLHDLPGLKLEEVIDVGTAGEVQAAIVVPQYYEAYENKFDLRIHRPARISVVCNRGRGCAWKPMRASSRRAVSSTRPGLGRRPIFPIIRPRPLPGAAAPYAGLSNGRGICG